VKGDTVEVGDDLIYRGRRTSYMLSIRDQIITAEHSPIEAILENGFNQDVLVVEEQHDGLCMAGDIERESCESDTVTCIYRDLMEERMKLSRAAWTGRRTRFRVAY